jgi:hypothetical protein
MALNFEPLFPCNIVLECFDLLIFEFDDRTTSGADQVIMLGVCVFIFKAGETILNPTFLGQACSSQQLQRTIYRCIANNGVCFSYPSVQIVGAKCCRASMNTLTMESLWLVDLSP